MWLRCNFSFSSPLSVSVVCLRPENKRKSCRLYPIQGVLHEFQHSSPGNYTGIWKSMYFKTINARKYSFETHYLSVIVLKDFIAVSFNCFNNYQSYYILSHLKYKGTDLKFLKLTKLACNSVVYNIFYSHSRLTVLFTHYNCQISLN